MAMRRYIYGLPCLPHPSILRESYRCIFFNYGTTIYTYAYQTPFYHFLCFSYIHFFLVGWGPSGCSAEDLGYDCQLPPLQHAYSLSALVRGSNTLPLHVRYPLLRLRAMTLHPPGISMYTWYIIALVFDGNLTETRIPRHTVYILRHATTPI